MQKYPNFAAMVRKICELTRADVIDWSYPEDSQKPPCAEFGGFSMTLTNEFVDPQLKIDDKVFSANDDESMTVLFELVAAVNSQSVRVSKNCAEPADKRSLRMEKHAAEILNKLRDASA